MHNLAALLEETRLAPAARVPADLSIEAVTDDSRRCGPGVLFVAIAGGRADGHQFLAQAAAAGAPAALVSSPRAKAPAGLHLIQVENTRQAYARLCQKLAGDPSAGMLAACVTGTNGKTTVTYMLEAILLAAGLKTGVLGTVNYRWGDHVELEPAPQTTPSPAELAEYLRRMRAEGVQALVMETSSHALDQHRVDGIQFRAAGFTNLTQDHLDYHRTMDEYRAAKERLFTEVLPAAGGGVAVLNLDDPAGRHYAERVRQTAPGVQVFSFSFHRPDADLLVDTVHVTRHGQYVRARLRGRPFYLQLRLHGLYNVQNALVAAGMALGLGLDHDAIAQGLAATRGAPGRFELVEAGQPFPVIVDYAHTPDSLQQTLLNACAFRTGRLIAVFGAGGDRDPGKRPQMGRVAARLADHIIVTNDNPRTEEPKAIAEMILDGIKEAAFGTTRWQVILDRASAIREAIRLAMPADVIVIAGKGHENYQDAMGRKTHFDDREQAAAAVAALRRAK
ncbi:MAG: UDP-N-acetylmuramoyl-L-alanyl-D-glutamate--2,6-diaminopimelate ligase [candidate division BRC1 bacterium ADurb.BinA292]|nr:MAG: UDP-N-acetylmuramoyl-L-alanyl-D-glutamate--2,6-diaminopimelate ligase [candidate division BRC1 bacterium ADurb.BinA292]